MSQNNQHLTTEQLSAFLDQQLSPEEQAAYNSHLPGCMQCQQEQAELKQTVLLLHALPEPTLPRTFVLPETPRVASVLPRKMLPVAKIPVAGRGNELPLYVRRSLQFMSALAAVVGIIFILSGLLYALPHAGTSSLQNSAMRPASSAHNTSSPTNTSTPVFRNTSPTSVESPSRDATAMATQQTYLPIKTPVTAAQARLPDESTLQPAVNTPAPEFLFFDLNSASGRLGLGLLLALAGFIGSTALKQRQKRR